MKRDWLQLLTNIAVVIGIGVLIYELNQTHLYNRSQVIAVDYQTLTDINLAMVGDNPAGAFAKSVTDPDQLTLEERFIVDTYLEAFLMEIMYVGHMYSIGVIENPFPDVSPRKGLVRRYLSHRFGRDWWGRNQDRFPESVRSVVDEVLSAESP